MYDPDLSVMLAATLALLLRPRDDDSPPATAILAGTIRQESTWHAFLTAFGAHASLFVLILLSSCIR